MLLPGSGDQRCDSTSTKGYVKTIQKALFILAIYLGLAIGPIIVLCSNAEAGAAVEVPRQQNIPHNYKSWSLFLVCNPSWVRTEGDRGISDLYKVFKTFGEAIGPQNAAIWFWKQKGRPAEANLDISRMSTFCEKYHVLPSKTPQVIVTTCDPNEAKADNVVIVNLNSNPEESAAALSKLTDQILLTGLNQRDLDENEKWRRFTTAAREVVTSVGCYLNKISFSFNLGPAKFEMEHSETRGCAP